MSLPPYALNNASFPELYEHCLVDPLFRPWAEVLMDRTVPGPGARVLDVACGTGIVARLAKARTGGMGKVVGVDLSPPMVAMARSVAPDIDWREGDAAALPLADGEQFDVVCCQQGLQFMPDKVAAVSQMRRALAPGGRLGIATWRPDAENPIFDRLRAVAERHLGSIVDMRHSFGETGPLRALLSGAGFADVRVETLTRTTRFDDGAVFARLNTMALVGMSPRAKELPDAERGSVVSAIVADSLPVLEAYAEGRGIAFEIATNIAIARG